MTWLLRLLVPFKAIWGYIAIGLGAIATIVTFGMLKKRQGRLEKESDDRESISEAQAKKRARDTAIRASPSGTSRERVRGQRDKLRELLRSKRPSDSE